MSSNKTLWDMPNDDALKKHIQSLNEQMLKQVQASPKLCGRSKTKIMDQTNADQDSKPGI